MPTHAKRESPRKQQAKRKPRELGAMAAGLVPVADRRGSLLGTGLYSPASEIALRLVSAELVADGATWLGMLRARLRAAIARRAPMLDTVNDACRLVFSEADELPGITVGR